MPFWAAIRTIQRPLSPSEPHDVARLWISPVFEDRSHCTSLDPGRAQRDAIHLDLDREGHADAAAPTRAGSEDC